MIKIQHINGLNIPIIICDTCKKQLKTNFIVVYHLPIKIQLNNLFSVKTFHKTPTCDDKSYDYSEESDVFFSQLIYNSKLKLLF